MNFSIEESKENDLVIKAATGNIIKECCKIHYQQIQMTMAQQTTETKQGIILFLLSRISVDNQC